MAKSTFDRRMASFAASLPVINSFVRGASRNIVLRRDDLLPLRISMRIFLCLRFGAATLVIGSPWGSSFVGPLSFAHRCTSWLYRL